MFPCANVTAEKNTGIMDLYISMQHLTASLQILQLYANAASSIAIRLTDIIILAVSDIWFLLYDGEKPFIKADIIASSTICITFPMESGKAEEQQALAVSWIQPQLWME